MSPGFLPRSRDSTPGRSLMRVPVSRVTAVVGDVTQPGLGLSRAVRTELARDGMTMIVVSHEMRFAQEAARFFPSVEMKGQMTASLLTTGPNTPEARSPSA